MLGLNISNLFFTFFPVLLLWGMFLLTVYIILKMIKKIFKDN